MTPFQHVNVLSDDIPLDPTMDMEPAEAASVRAELRAAVRAAGDNWRPLVEAHLKQYGCWIDPKEIERARAEAERELAAQIALDAEREADAKPATCGEVRAVEREVSRLRKKVSRCDQNISVLTDAVIDLESGKAVQR